jgi:hypothetical protein
MATFDDILNEIAPATYEKVGHQREDGRATAFIERKHHPQGPMSSNGIGRILPEDQSFARECDGSAAPSGRPFNLSSLGRDKVEHRSTQ